MGFLVYVTMRGELPQYGAAFMGDTGGSSAGGLGSLTGGMDMGDVTGMVSGFMGGGSGDMDMSSMMGMAAMAAAFV